MKFCKKRQKIFNIEYRGGFMQQYSVLMSLYRNENPEHLQLSLDSMVTQTVKPDEIVLVEDGELTPELYSVVDRFKKRYPDIMHIVKNEKNLGLGLSLRKGVLACRNELIVRMDTDDIAIADRCEKQLDFFEKNKDIAILGGQIEEFIVNVDNITGKRIVPTKDSELKYFMKKRCPFNHVTVMFKKSDIISVGNYQEWFCNEDYHLWIRLADANKKFANLSEVLVCVRIGEEMYARRGGMRYFQSELGIQNLLLKKKYIGILRYLVNISERFAVQVLMPNNIRGMLYKKFARTN